MWGYLEFQDKASFHEKTADLQLLPRIIELQDTKHFIGRSSIHPQDSDKIVSAIPLPFISTIHYMVAQVDSEFQLTDLSRNGTFVNDRLVGKDKTITIHPNDIITIKFRSESRILYKFISLNDNNISLNQEILKIETSPSPNGNAQRDIFLDQIEMLRQENKAMQLRQNELIEKNEEILREKLSKENEVKLLNTRISQLEESITEYKEDKLEYDANLVSANARISLLEESLENKDHTITELKNKVSHLSSELEFKTTALSKRENTVEDVNHVLIDETLAREKLQSENDGLWYQYNQLKQTHSGTVLEIEILRDHIDVISKTFENLQEQHKLVCLEVRRLQKMGNEHISSVSEVLLAQFNLLKQSIFTVEGKLANSLAYLDESLVVQKISEYESCLTELPSIPVLRNKQGTQATQIDTFLTTDADDGNASPTSKRKRSDINELNHQESSPFKREIIQEIIDQNIDKISLSASSSSQVRVFHQNENISENIQEFHSSDEPGQKESISPSDLVGRSVDTSL